MTTPTPAQQLEEFMALRKAAATALANKESATACQLEDDAADIARDLARDHADTLRRALAALEAVEMERRMAKAYLDAGGDPDYCVVRRSNGTGYVVATRIVPPADAVEVSRG